MYYILFILCLLYIISKLNEVKNFGNKKILIIGNSPNVKEHNFSNLINSGEFTVIRFNNWHLGLETSKEYTGNHVDYTFINNIGKGRMFFEHPNERILMSDQSIFKSIYYTFISLIIDCYKDFHVIKLHSKGDEKLSNGLRIILFFVDRGIVPYIHGFTLDDSSSSREHMYKEKSIFTKSKGKHHNFSYEKLLLNKLLQEGKIKMLKDYNE